MKPNLRAEFREAAKVLGTLLAMVVLLVPIGCGDGGGDGAEDTGSILHASAVAADEGGRNVDIASDDTNNNGVPDAGDNLIADTLVTFTFTNVSVVPDQDTATTLRIESYTIDYLTIDPAAPALDSRSFGINFVIDPDTSVERADILLVALDTVEELNDKGPPPQGETFEYTAHFTFHGRNVPFDQAFTATANVAFSFGDFLPSN
jgi:hypothetical protein